MQHLTEGLVPLLLAVSSHAASHGQTLHFVVALTNLGVGWDKSITTYRPTVCSFPDSSDAVQGAWPRKPKGLLRTLPSLFVALTSDVTRRRTEAIAGRILDALIERELGGG